MKQEYFEGNRYRCIAYYDKFYDRVDELVHSVEEMETFVQEHNAKGANVSVYRCAWTYNEHSYLFLDGAKRR